MQGEGFGTHPQGGWGVEVKLETGRCVEGWGWGQIYTCRDPPLKG